MKTVAADSRLESIKRLVLYENGRLGNQLFQYIFARTSAPHANITCIGFESLESLLLNGLGSIRVEDIVVKTIFRRLGRERALRLARDIGVFGYVSEKLSDNQLSVSSKPGLVSGVSLLDGFFQDERLLLNVSCKYFPLRNSVLEAAKQWIYDNVVSCGLSPYFLHVRRGDYVHWPAKESPAVLPFFWLKEQITNIMKSDNYAHFIICTDDIPYAEDFFGSNPRFTIFKGSEIQDFAIMTQCSGGGILSASSFAWWAAWYGKQYHPKTRYIAPLHWAGWPKRTWFPSTIETSWLQYECVQRGEPDVLCASSNPSFHFLNLNP
jgi:hypothetical protein